MSNVSMTTPNFDTAGANKVLQPAGYDPDLAMPVAFSGCTGMLHPAAGETGVIILSPFGYEAMASHKTFRLFAESLAASGMPVLRFDYPGTGDAPGNEINRELIASRCKAVSDACQFLRQQGNVRNIAFVGLRLGAAIAALSAKACDVQQLVMIEPVVSGQDWLQQLETLHQVAGVREFRSGRKVKGGGREFLGYGMSMASLEALKGLHLSWHLPSQSCRVLMMYSDKSPGADDLAQQWIGDGLDVDARPYSAFAQLIAEPTLGTPPVKSLEGITGWLAPRDVSSETVTFRINPPTVTGTDYKEQPVYFGDTTPRYGVLCEPLGLRKPGPALLLLNTGGIPHTGWGRQSVGMARYLARQGFVTFRIDVNGIGETPDIMGRPARLFYAKSSAADASAAIDWLERAGYKTPAIIGVCGGAYLAFQTALADERVSGLLLVNMKKFNWSEKDTRIMWQGRKTPPQFSDAVDPAAGSSIWKSAFARLVPWFRDDNDQLDVLQAIKAKLDQGMRISLVYCKGDIGVSDMEAHLGKKGRNLRDYHNFSVGIINPASHVFDTSADRAKLYPVAKTFAESLEVARLRQLTGDQLNNPEILPGLGSVTLGPKPWSLRPQVLVAMTASLGRYDRKSWSL